MKKHWQDWGNLALGLWVIASPWVLQHAMVTGAPAANAATNSTMWNLYIVGAAIAALAGAAIFIFQAWEEWTNVALGAWLFVSPWALGFSASALLMWNAIIVGALVVFLAGWMLIPTLGSTQGPAKTA